MGWGGGGGGGFTIGCSVWITGRWTYNGRGGGRMLIGEGLTGALISASVEN